LAIAHVLRQTYLCRGGGEFEKVVKGPTGPVVNVPVFPVVKPERGRAN
jgi:hypothetical protein